MTHTTLASPFELPNGQTVRNRIAKSAMSETLATSDGGVTEELLTLYERWAHGGVGLCITGNVMVDPAARGEPGNVVVEDDRDIAALTEWASRGKSTGATLYMQLNHPGRQAPRFLNDRAVAPSAVPLREEMRDAFPPPEELTAVEIEAIIARFANSATVVERAGFDGVQIHGAHGYLVNQFLSPLTNQRTDDWGGSPEKRRRFVIEIARAIRAATGPEFGLGIKINSADFQRGGFTEEESQAAIVALGAEGLDFIEISGGTYEAPAMTGARESTREREAYFLEFATRIRDHVETPLMVTGGFRTGTVMAAAIDSGAVDFVGLARPLAVRPEFPAELTTDDDAAIELHPIRVGWKVIDRFRMQETIWYERQLLLIGRGEEPRPDEHALVSMVKHGFRAGLKGFKTRRG